MSGIPPEQAPGTGAHRAALPGAERTEPFSRHGPLDQRTDPVERDHPAPDDPVTPWPGGPRALTVHLRAWWAVAAVALCGVSLIATNRMLVGGVALSGSFVLAAVLRTVLPEDIAAGLHIRQRGTDIVMYLVTAAVVLLAVLVVLRKL